MVTHSCIFGKFPHLSGKNVLIFATNNDYEFEIQDPLNPINHELNTAEHNQNHNHDDDEYAQDIFEAGTRASQTNTNQRVGYQGLI